MPAGAGWRRAEGGRTARVWAAEWGGGGVVVKLTPPDAGTPMFRNDAEVEAAMLRALRGSPPLAPALRGAFAWGRAACLVAERLSGRAPAHACPELLAALARLHSTVTRPPVVLPPLPPLRPGLGRRLDANGDALGLTPAAKAWIDKARAEIRESDRRACGWGDAKSGGAALLHGDPVPANAILRGGTLALVDWTCAGLGDPVLDIAIALSPAMQRLYGVGPWRPQAASHALNAYGDTEVVARYLRLAPALHADIAGHCLWRAARGEVDFLAAALAEVEILNAPLRPG